MRRIALVFLMLLPISLMAETRYTILKLAEGEIADITDDLNFINIQGAVAINKSGQVAITVSSCIALRYTDGIGSELLGYEKVATDINDHGQVVAFGVDAPDLGVTLCRYSDKEGWEQLTEYGEFYALGINNRGQIVGIDGIGGQMVRYTDGIGIEELGPALGFGINDRGWITGIGLEGAFLYKDEFSFIGLASGRGNAINKHGAIAGSVSGNNLPEGAFLYEHGTLKLLDEFTTSSGASAMGINDHNNVVGFAQVGDEHHAFIWSEKEGMRDLNELIDLTSGWLLWKATGINNSGQICGNGIFEGQYLPFRLDPIKHPPKKPTQAKSQFPTTKSHEMNWVGFHGARTISCAAAKFLFAPGP